MTVFKISISGTNCKSMVFLSHDEAAGECLYCACSYAHVSVCMPVCTCTHVHARSKLHIHFILVSDLFPSCVYVVMLPITFQFILWCANRGILQSKNGQLYIKGVTVTFSGFVIRVVSASPTQLLYCGPKGALDSMK